MRLLLTRLGRLFRPRSIQYIKTSTTLPDDELLDARLRLAALERRAHRQMTQRLIFAERRVN